MPEEIEKRGDEGGDVGPGGGAEDGVDGLGFRAGGDETHFGENLEGAAGGLLKPLTVKVRL